jgi:aminoglycoside phosphotransferase (APT) family kinase protein
LLGTLHLDPRGWYGELLADEPVRADTWREYLRDRAASSLRASTPSLQGVDAAAVAEGLPDTTSPAFVHLDAFAGNMLAVGTAITAVLDVGPTSVAGDRRLDPLAAAAYLSAPQITPVATPRDVDVAQSWLRSAGLLEFFKAATSWLAPYWSFAVDDQRLLEWCQIVLAG